MARPPFSTSIIGLATKSSSSVPGGSTVSTPTGRFCSETPVGALRRKPKGWTPPTPYSLSRYEYQRAYGSDHYQVVPSNWTKVVGCIDAGGVFNTLNHFNSCCTDATARVTLSTSAAIVAARGKLKDKRVDLGVAFAERKQASMMLGDTATRMANAARSLRRGEFRNAARQLGIRGQAGRPRGSNWVNHWMQLQYGWKPLLSDVYGACSALSKRDKGDWCVTAKAARRDTDEFTWYSPPQAGSIGNLAGSCSVVATRQRGVFVRIDAVPVNDLTMSLASLGVTNPLLVAWELLPYSFVVDWALPVGSWLDSLDALLGFGSAWTSTTTYNNTEWTDTGLSKEYSPTQFIRRSYVGSKRLLEVNRTASSGVPLPAFPRFKDPRSLGHMANGLSLLAQAFSHK